MALFVSAHYHTVIYLDQRKLCDKVINKYFRGRTINAMNPINI